MMQHVVCIMPRDYDLYKYHNKSFIVTNDEKRKIRNCDYLELKERSEGRYTGRVLIAKIKRIERDCPGIQNGYCVIEMVVIEEHKIA